MADGTTSITSTTATATTVDLVGWYIRGAGVVTVSVAEQTVGALMLSAWSALDTEYTEQLNVRPPAGGSKFNVRNAYKNRYSK